MKYERASGEQCHDQLRYLLSQSVYIIPKRPNKIIPCDTILRCLPIRSFLCLSIAKLNSANQSICLILDTLVDALHRGLLLLWIRQVVSKCDGGIDARFDGGDQSVGTRDIRLGFGPGV